MGCDKQENYVLKIFGLYFSRINSSNVQDECIFTLFDEDTNTDIDVVLFVDDFLTSSRNGHSSNHILNILKEKYGEVVMSSTSRYCVEHRAPLMSICQLQPRILLSFPYRVAANCNL